MIPNWWRIKRRRVNSGVTSPESLVVNANVEAGTVEPDSWFRSASTEWVTGNNRALRINVVNDVADWRSAVYPVEGGATYDCGMWVKGAADIVTVLAVRWFSDLAGTQYLTETWIVLQGANATWTKHHQEIQAPYAARSGDLMFRVAFASTVDVLGDAFFVQKTLDAWTSLTFQTNRSGAFNPSVTVSDGSTVIWDYGDGTTSTGVSANKTYPNGNTKTVRVFFANPAAVTHLAFHSQSLVGSFDLSQLASLTGLLEFSGYSNTSWQVTGSLANLPSGMAYLHLGSTQSVITGGSTTPLAMGLQVAYLYSMAYTQAQLDELLQYIYTYRAQWTASAPLLHIGGSNPAASGTYADQDPPTTGKAYIYELVNDPEAEGFSLWAITYTA